MSIEMELLYRYAIAYTIRNFRESENPTEKQYWREEIHKVFDAREKIKEEE